MTYRLFSIGLAGVLAALAPATASAFHTLDHFDDFSGLYQDIDIDDEPYYGSSYYDNDFDDYRYRNYDYDYRYPSHSYSGRYHQQSNMRNFRCYYWGRDGSCMNYSYRQAPTYYNYGYPYYNYGSYGNYYGNYNYGNYYGSSYYYGY